ncbi:PDDEXK nuclease domain-containing protein [Paraburkholderia silvatlantica]|uniref:PDDEXK nuclease domain-containing protein n=1 Tax=Paraburkholderia silvatlantica TaxID=321895 RepID=UPI001060FF81|nr:PDDEXK nuclease domain-containing protein [Paraburkholderia silvatlantica]TDQ73615.1 putative nuclease of restriction endonuclease-like (RecB) superfamily [Paraburkholderia silvatlantica]
MTKPVILPGDYAGLHDGVVRVVESARQAAARNVNAVMTAAYWEIGRRIVGSEQGGRARAGYGQALIAHLADDLTRRFGRGFGRANLASMRAFYLAWPENEIFQTLSGKSEAPNLQTPSGKLPSAGGAVTAGATTPDYLSLASRFTLPWSAYVRLLSVKTEAARTFYETEALRQGWSVRQLDRQIGSQLYERLALSRNKAALLSKAGDAQPGDVVTPEEAIRDPFVLEFLDIRDEYSESDLEAALIQHLADFLLELGDDFAFLGRQRRLRIDDTWFRVDLVFFHRGLKCLVIIDLKVGRFSYADAGQMHLYLNYAREHWMKPGENPPVGLILCAEKGAAEAHYALDNLPNKILAAEYRTVLPDETLIAEELERTRVALEERKQSARFDEGAPES